MKALEDMSPDVRSSAVRIAERWLGTPNHPMTVAVLKLTGDPHWSVREQLAASLGVLPPGAREVAAAAMLERHASESRSRRCNAEWSPQPRIGRARETAAER